MEYRTLGRTGMHVSTFCLGTMVLGAWGNRDEDECQAIVHAALDAGINFIDTADMYAFGESEEIVGRALRGRRDAVILATKFFNPMGEDPNHRGASRRWIVRAVEDSLRRLDTDWIDLYQVHRPDPDTDLDETLGALSDLVHAGKIRAFGTSTFPAEVLVEAQWMADRRGHVLPSTEQPPYSIFARGIERAVLPTCQRYGLGVLVWAPLNGGWLTGKYRDGQAPRGVEGGARAGPLRLRRDGARAQDGAGGGPAEGGRRSRAATGRPGARVRARAPGRDVGHRRASHAWVSSRTPWPVPARRSPTRCGTAWTRWSRPVSRSTPYDDGYEPPDLGDASRRRR